MTAKETQTEKPAKKSSGLMIGIIVFSICVVVLGAMNETEEKAGVDVKSQKNETIQTVEVKKPVEDKLPEYILIGKERRGANADGVYLVHIYLPNAVTDTEVEKLNNKLTQELGISQYPQAQIRYFDNRLGAQTYSDKVMLSEREVERFFDDWIYKYDHDTTAQQTEKLQKQVNGEWVIVTAY